MTFVYSLILYLEDWIRYQQKSLAQLTYKLPHSVLWHSRSQNDITRPSSRTAYLDGIRGQAALGVAILHMTLGFFSAANHAYNGEEGKDYLFQMPFIRLSYTGQPTLFFFISGYVISSGTLKKIRSRSFGPLQLDLSSKLFRRGFRLCLPAVLATIPPMLFTYFNFFPSVVQFSEEMPHHEMHLPDPQPSLIEHVYAWLWSISPILWPFDWSIDPSMTTPWAYQLWTIPVEFRDSIFLLVLLTALARFTPPARLSLTTMVWASLLTFELWDISLFVAGAIFAEIDLIKQECNAILPAPLSPPKYSSHSSLVSDSTRSSCWNAFLWSVLIVSLWILSVPADNISGSYSFPILEAGAPLTYTSAEVFRFWDALGTVMLLGATTCLPVVQAFFSHPFWLYLGKISFSLYLTHTIVLKAVMYPLVPYALMITGWETDAGYSLGILTCGVVYLGISIWVAEMFHQHVEKPCAKLTVWIDQWLSTLGDDEKDIAIAKSNLKR
ncbi:MAG: hypothetical protein Q9227_007120 [Pyrenula ochraceoflavens]